MPKQLDGIVLDLSGLESIERGIARRASKLVVAVAEEIVTDAKAGAPVRTGTLRRSYHRQPVDALTQRVGTDLEYAPYVEFGTSKMAARPHFLPAIERGRRTMAKRAAELFGTSGA